MMKRLPWLFAIVLMLTLAACSSSDDKDKEKAKDEARVEVSTSKRPLPICPQVAILRELDYIPDYGAEKSGPGQLVAESRMENVSGDCAYRDDGVDIKFDLGFLAARGPRLGGNHIGFPFFTAVVDPDQKVLDKNRMTVEFDFSEDKKPVERIEHMHVFIPLPKSQRETGPGYQVLLGFQLTQEQVDTIRAKASKITE